MEFREMELREMEFKETKFKEKNVLVFGSGISGVAASRLLLKKGARVVLYDGNASLDAGELAKRVLGAGEALGSSLGDAAGGQSGDDGRLAVLLGDLPEQVRSSLSLVVMSPGVPTDLPVVLQMKEEGIPIWGEVELAYACSEGEVLAITGTNGKTTTTTLLGEIMKHAQRDTYVVGNIGNPYTEIALEMTEESVAVAEMSSFQLETIHDFHPRVSAVLNITPDHLNRHHTMENYIAAKKNIFKNQTEKDVLVLNYEDEVTREFAKDTKARVLFFSSKRKLPGGIYLQDGRIVCDAFYQGTSKEVCHVDELQILGQHNYENVMAATGMAVAFGVPCQVIRETLLAFRGVEHRIEFVAEKDGVAYYNDSKGTNPDAAIKGIQAMNRPTLLIGGGYDKDSSYEEWIKAFDGKVKKLVLIGATREKIAKAANRLGFTDTILADGFEEAFDICVKHARAGDAVLLSPACASWGMFKNYEERGDKFKELVNHL